MKRIIIVFAILVGCAAGQTRININWLSFLKPTTFANLPGSPFTNQIWAVNDCLTAACAAGGGSVTDLLIWSGSAWIVYGSSSAVAPSLSFPVTVSGTVTSGGVPYFSSATQMSSSAANTAGAPMTWGGAGTAPGQGTIALTYGGLGITSGTNGGVPCFTSGSTTALTAGPALGSGSVVVGGGGAACPSATSMTLQSTGFTSGYASGSNFSIVTASDSSSNVALGGYLLRGPDEIGAGGATAISKPSAIRAGNNASTNTSAQAGFLGIFGGAATGATSTGHQGSLQTGQYYVKGSTVTQWNLQQLQNAAETTKDAVASPAYILGVAEAVGSISVLVIDRGEVPINASAAVTVGDTVCAGTTAGQVTDSGGQGACSTGILVGVVTRVAGTYVMPDGTSAAGSGTSVTLSTTLPMVKLTR